MPTAPNFFKHLCHLGYGRSSQPVPQQPPFFPYIAKLTGLWYDPAIVQKEIYHGRNCKAEKTDPL